MGAAESVPVEGSAPRTQDALPSSTPTLTAALINDDLEEAQPPKRSIYCDATFYTSALGLVNAMLGAGVLAYPYAYMGCGLLVGVLLSLAIGVMSTLALSVLLPSMSIAHSADPSVRSFGDLVRYVFGPRAGGAIDALIVLYAFGACVGYLILLGDMLTPPFQALGLPLTWNSVIAVLSVACLLLCCLPTVSALKYTAVAGILATGFIVAMLVMQAVERPCRLGQCGDECGREGWCNATQARATPQACSADVADAGVSAWPMGVSELLRSLPLLTFALQCHIQSVIVYVEMPTRLRTSRALSATAVLATVLILCLYVPIGLAGFLRFGAQTQGDVLKNFGVADGLADAARICIACAALSSFPMQHFPARLALYGIYRRTCRRASADGAALAPPLLFIAVEATAWVAVTLAVAELVGSAISLVFQLVGAVCGSTVIFTLPGAIWLKLGPKGRTRVVVGGLLLLTGGFILLAGTAVTVQQIVQKFVDPSSSTADRACSS